MKALRNGLAAAARVADTLIAGEDPRADNAVRQKRLSICHSCNYLDGSRCSECKCFVRIKTMLKTETCPHKFW